jgi:hypothetical protein
VRSASLQHKTDNALPLPVLNNDRPAVAICRIAPLVIRSVHDLQNLLGKRNLIHNVVDVGTVGLGARQQGRGSELEEEKIE